MPNRSLRDWTDSKKMSKVSFQEEVLFTRLIMKADDYGNFHADPLLIKNLLFPRKENMRSTDISRWLTSLQAAGLIRTYTAENENYVHIVKFLQIQRMRYSKRKFPQSPFENQPDKIPPESAASCGENPPVVVDEVERKRKEVESRQPPTPHEIFLIKFEADNAMKEIITMQTKKNLDKNILQSFNAHLITEGKKHEKYTEWTSHLRNWLNTNPELKHLKQPSFNTGKAFKA